jgi:fatty-acyl-CoA synthase
MNKKATGTIKVGDYLKIAAIRYRDREAIFCSSTGRRFTFMELNRRTNQLANGLMAMGLIKGDAAAFICTNRAEIVEIYFALAKIGVIGIPLNYRLAPAEMIELIRHCDARALLFDPWFTEIATQIRDQLPRVKYFVGMGDNLPDFVSEYEQFLSDNPDKEPDVDVSEEDYQYLNLTSGTTGLPKAYMLTHYNNGIACPVMSDLHHVTKDDVILTAFPIFGRVGFAWCAIAVYTGARNVIHQFNPQEILPLIESEKITLSNWVPTMASFVLAQPDAGKYDVSSLRALVFAASPLASSLQKEIKEKICPNLYEFYGLQETGILVNIGPEEKNRKPDSVGQVIFTADVRIVDTDGKEVPTGKIGDIIGRGPAVTAGYFKNEEKTKEAFKNGWFYTGDLGYMDEEGFLFLAGRSKDMIISGGQNIFAVEVEDVLMGHPAVADCAVIGLPDKTWGEAVTAVVVKVPEENVTEAELIDYARKKIAGFKTPKKIIMYEGLLPRTPTGKVTKYVLTDKYASKV